MPTQVQEIAAALPYRDFITVGLVLKKLALPGAVDRDGVPGRVPDNWIYIQEPDVQVGRLQVFKDWSLFWSLTQTRSGWEWSTCHQEGDELWNMADEDMIAFGVRSSRNWDHRRGPTSSKVRSCGVQKTYPAYFGAYRRFDEVREFVVDSRTSSWSVERHASIQQQTLDADCNGGREQHPRWSDRQIEHLGCERRAGSTTWRSPRREPLGPLESFVVMTMREGSRKRRRGRPRPGRCTGAG